MAEPGWQSGGSARWGRTDSAAEREIGAAARRPTSSLHITVLFDHRQPLGLPGELVFVVSSEKRGSAVASYDYCIESKHPIAHRLLPGAALPRAYQDCSQAVAIAAKCVPNHFGDDVWVVHVPSGEIVFRVVSPEGLPGSASASSH